MENHDPWLVLQKGRKVSLLAQDHRAYYVIDVDEHLSYEMEMWLAGRGISEELLRELKLSYEFISKTAVRGVAIGGWTAGDSVWLYLNSGKRRYVLSDDCSKEWMDRFFLGVARFTPPKEKSKPSEDDWRKARQDPELYEKMKYVPPILTVLNVIFGIAYLLNRTWPLYLVWLLCLAAPVVMDILYPAYFTLIPEKKGKKKDAWELEFPLLAHVILLILLPDINWLNDGAYLAVIALSGGGVTLLLGLLAEEFKRRKGYLWAVFLLAGLIGMFSAGQINEVFDFSQPEAYVLVVEDLGHTSSRRNRRYECEVTLPDGRQVELDISRSLYNQLEIGDQVLVELSTGALGIEYANVYPAE